MATATPSHFHVCVLCLIFQEEHCNWNCRGIPHGDLDPQGVRVGEEGGVDGGGGGMGMCDVEETVEEVDITTSTL